MWLQSFLHYYRDLNPISEQTSHPQKIYLRVKTCFLVKVGVTCSGCGSGLQGMNVSQRSVLWGDKFECVCVCERKNIYASLQCLARMLLTLAYSHTHCCNSNCYPQQALQACRWSAEWNLSRGASPGGTSRRRSQIEARCCRCRNEPTGPGSIYRAQPGSLHNNTLIIARPELFITLPAAVNVREGNNVTARIVQSV